MRTYLILGLITVFLVMGCIGEPSPVNNTQNQSNSSPATSNNTSTLSLEQKTVADYKALLAQGKAIECTIHESTEDGAEIDTILKIKGKNMNMETKVKALDPTTGTFRNETMKIILRDNKSYVYASTFFNTQQTNCDWIETSTETETGEIRTPEEYFEAAGEGIECVQGTFGDEVFVPQGKVCSMQDLGGMMNNY